MLKLSGCRTVSTAVLIAAKSALATTYYVSPTGSDANSGTSPGTPWSSVAKVDGSEFQPGDQILFQYGGLWNGGLTATSSGTTTAPITYGAYGNKTLASPTFSGSDPINNSAFTFVSGTTYSMPAPSAVNWVYDHEQFIREAQDATGSSDPTTDLNFVNSTSGSFYCSPSGTLYVNIGTKLTTGQQISIGSRQDAVFNGYQSNLVFKNLSTTDTAVDQQGYGFRVERGNNVTILNATATNSGKHSFGVINSTGFVGANLVASQNAPDQGFGGASAFVAFSDSSRTNMTTGGDTSVWNNLTYYNQFGSYPAFISHGSSYAIGSVAINNLVSNNGYGSGVDIQTTSAVEKASLTNSTFTGAGVELDTSNTLVDHVTMIGDAALSITGDNSVVQNSTFIGEAPNINAAHLGALLDSGGNNTFRFNTFTNFAQNVMGPAIAIESATSNTMIYGNLFNVTQPLGAQYDGGGKFVSYDNVFVPGSILSGGDIYNTSYITLATWMSIGGDPGSQVGTPVLNSDNTLSNSSPVGVGIYTAGFGSTLSNANALLGPNSTNGGFNAGVDNVLPPIVLASGTSSLIQFPVSAGQTGYSAGIITIGPGAKLTLSTTPTATADRGMLIIPSITFSPTVAGGTSYTGQFDIGINVLDITSMTLAQVTVLVGSGFNLAGGGKWDGAGIVSSAAGNDTSRLTAIGVVANSTNGISQLFGSTTAAGYIDGISPGFNDILVMYTYFGDANLDGKVDGSDYTLIDAGYASRQPGFTGTPLTGWYNGDFNYDGIIDGTDYGLIDNAFNNQAAPVTSGDAALVAAGNAETAAPAAVPEPTAIAGLLVVGLALVRNRIPGRSVSRSGRRFSSRR